MNNILITGGTGFFGRTFTRYLLENNLANKICIYSRDEYKQSVMKHDFVDDRMRFFIGDVRDRSRLTRACRDIDIVVHAAALKRIEVGHYAPEEMVQTNVYGAMNVVDAAYDAGVKKVVALSTDKAYQPISPYGQTKALAESLFLAANASHIGPRYSVVRYGNVWKSTGSIVPVWLDLLSRGVPRVPVTDPDCTRFFMTADEACSLVWQAVEELPKEVLIPDWLPAYRVGDLAAAMGAEMAVGRLPSWEKKHESMNDDLCSETARRMTVGELQGFLDDSV
jgi:UDP-N-acetylglucosamine 4,6-dehydratase